MLLDYIFGELIEFQKKVQIEDSIKFNENKKSNYKPKKDNPYDDLEEIMFYIDYMDGTDLFEPDNNSLQEVLEDLKGYREYWGVKSDVLDSGITNLEKYLGGNQK